MMKQLLLEVPASSQTISTTATSDLPRGWSTVDVDVVNIMGLQPPKSLLELEAGTLEAALERLEEARKKREASLREYRVRLAQISASLADEGIVPPQRLAEVIPIFDAGHLILRREAAAMARIKELASESAEDNWDGEQGHPIVARQWDDVRAVVSRTLRELPEVPPPFLSACGDGTAHVTWTTAVGNRGVLEVGKSSYWWSYIPIRAEYGQDEVKQIPTPDVVLQEISSLFG